MTFKIPFVPPLPAKFFNDESSRKKNLAVVRSGPQPNHVLRETLLPWKKLLEADEMIRGKIFERGKNIEKSQPL